MKENIESKFLYDSFYRKLNKRMVECLGLIREYFLDLINDQNLPLIFLERKEFILDKLQEVESDLKYCNDELDRYNDIGICYKDIFL